MDGLLEKSPQIGGGWRTLFHQKSHPTIGMSFLNTVVDRVYVINMDKHKDRLAKFDAQMRKYNIAYTRVPGIVGAEVTYDEGLSPFCNKFCTAGMKGCALSHRSIWEDMVKNRYDNVAIFEDDAILEENFHEKLRQVWEQLPADYDIFYLGCHTLCDNTHVASQVLLSALGSKDPEDVTPNLRSVDGSGGLYGYIISGKCAKTVLETTIDTHVDIQFGSWIKQFNLKAYSSNPVIVIANENGDSSISENFPQLFNSLLRNVLISDVKPLDWLMSENFLQVGWYSFNATLTILSFLVCILPYRYCFGILAWILVEGIYAQDWKSASKYIQFLGGLLILRWTLSKKLKLFF